MHGPGGLMNRLLAKGVVFAIVFSCLFPVLFPVAAFPTPEEEAPLPNPQQSTSSVLTEINNSMNILNQRIVLVKRQHDSLRVRVDAMEADVRAIRAILPQLEEALNSAVDTRTSMSSAEVAMANQLSLLMNKISLLEEKTTFIDSTNFEILSQLVTLEDRIISLASSFNDVRDAQIPGVSRPGPITEEAYQQRYIDALSAYQDGRFEAAIQDFTALLSIPMRHELADNAQYWLAECYYSTRDFRRAIMEFERVFSYTGSNKAADAQYKIALCYLQAGEEQRARLEFQRLVDQFPNSELIPRAIEYLQY
ncbi:tetratricopeptide repeat protein [Candidatus Neomarinimicrobiota bacterium]